MPAFNNNKISNKVSSKKTKRSVPKITYNVRSVDEYLMYAASKPTRDILFKETVEGIRNSIVNNKDVADIFCLPGSKDNTTFSVDKKYWKGALKSAIDHYAAHDQFDQCIDCQQLINML
jgi:hypothetical protein